jgi:hypothetical protein
MVRVTCCQSEKHTPTKYADGIWATSFDVEVEKTFKISTVL